MVIIGWIFNFFVVWRYCKDSSFVEVISQTISYVFALFGVLFFYIIGEMFFLNDARGDDTSFNDDKEYNKHKIGAAKEGLKGFMLSVFLTSFFLELFLTWLKFIETKPIVCCTYTLYLGKCKFVLFYSLSII